MARHYGVRSQRYKLVHYYRNSEWELFDLESDPNELKSVYSDPAYVEVVADMKTELTRIRKQYKDDGSVVEYNPPRVRKGRQQKKKGRAVKK